MKVTFGVRLAIGIAAWLFMILYIFFMPISANAAPGSAVVPLVLAATAQAERQPPQVDPAEWYVDANALFRYTLAQLHNAKSPPLAAADKSAARARCLTVAMEYNKRSSKIKVGGKPRQKPGADADGPYSGFKATEDFFEKRGLPRTLDARECRA